MRGYPRTWESPLSQPLTRRDCRDLLYHVARMREAKGDKEGAARARTGARAVSGDKRRRHDL
jgi:hypothetical protein